MITLLVDNWGILGSTADILEGYILLDANAVLQVCRSAVIVSNLGSRTLPRDMPLSFLTHYGHLYMARARITRDLYLMLWHCYSSWLIRQLIQSRCTRAACSRC